MRPHVCPAQNSQLYTTDISGVSYKAQDTTKSTLVWVIITNPIYMLADAKHLPPLFLKHLSQAGRHSIKMFAT